MSQFIDNFPDAVILASLGDEIIYQAITGDVIIKALVSSAINQVFSGEAYLSEKQLQMDVMIEDAPGLKKGSKFMIDAKKYQVDTMIQNDGHVVTCLLVLAG